MLSVDRMDPGEAGPAFRSFFERYPHPMWVFDTKTLRFLAANEAAAVGYGYAREEFLAMRVADLWPPEDPASPVPGPASGAHSRMQRHRTRSGAVLDVQVSTHELVWEGTPACVLTAVDRTGDNATSEALASARQEYEMLAERLRQSEERYRLMIEGSEQVFFYLHDVEGRFEYVSPSVERMLGYRPEELVGRPYGVLLAGDPSDDAVRENTDEAIRSGIALPTYPAVTRRKDGCTVWIEVTERPLLRDGVVIGIQGFARDITERRLGEEKLHRLHARMAAVVDTSPLAIVVLDREHTVQLWNRAAERMFGWSTEEVIGRPYPLLSTDRGTEPEQIFAAAMAGTRFEGIDIRRLHRDGGVLELRLWNSQLVDDQDRICGLVGIFADASKERALEEQLRQAQKMEAVGRLAGGIAHDFNNILTAIHGYADLALDEVEPGQPLHADLVEIRRSARRAASLTRQLLAFSRKQILQPRVLDLGTVITEVRRMLLRLIGADIELIARIDPDLNRVTADPGQIEQVILNLAVNARDAMPGGGTLSIEARNIEIGPADPRPLAEAPPGSYVALVVRDTGTGIDPDHLPHIFEPFFTTREVGKGTGLGLATVYGIVKQSGGYVSVESELGRGTTFHILLPVADADSPQEQEQARPAAGAPAGETILVVEDEPSVRALTRRALLREGYSVLEASDGLEAIVLARRHTRPIHLLLTDLVMPRMSGHELAARLRQLLPGLRVLFMSGYSEEMISFHHAEQADAPFLPKPFSPNSLAERVREALAGSATQR